MRPLPKYLVLACTTTALLIAGCGGIDAKSSTNTNASPSATAASETTAAFVVAGGTVPTTDAAPTPTAAAAPVATPSSDPCDLLTAAVAGQALGMAVGDKSTQPGEGNTTCGYRPADPAAQGFVSLTLYGVTGSEAILNSAAQQFPDAEAVDGIGDAALLSMQGQAIGVLSGTTVFALGLFPQQADGQLVPVTKDQLIALAHAVLAGQ